MFSFHKVERQTPPIALAAKRNVTNNTLSLRRVFCFHYKLHVRIKDTTSMNYFGLIPHHVFTPLLRNKMSS